MAYSGSPITALDPPRSKETDKVKFWWTSIKEKPLKISFV